MSKAPPSIEAIRLAESEAAAMEREVGFYVAVVGDFETLTREQARAKALQFLEAMPGRRIVIFKPARVFSKDQILQERATDGEPSKQISG